MKLGAYPSRSELLDQSNIYSVTAAAAAVLSNNDSIVNPGKGSHLIEMRSHNVCFWTLELDQTRRPEPLLVDATVSEIYFVTRKKELTLPKVLARRTKKSLSERKLSPSRGVPSGEGGKTDPGRGF